MRAPFFPHTGRTPHLVAALFVAAIIPAVVALAESPEGKTYPVLASCSRLDRTYDALGFSTADFDRWREIYHRTVNEVIEEYFTKPEIDCSAETPRGLLKSERGRALFELAQMLPPWKDGETLEFLSRADTGLVLLEYLRIYECALQEHTDTLEFDLTLEKAKSEATERIEGMGADPGDSGVFDGVIGALKRSFLSVTYPDLTRDALLRRTVISRELGVSRTTLHRALTYIGAYDRFRPLEAELECTQRISLDIRNVTALSAEASACLPRVWNAKGPLRNAPE